jgi:predicted Rossmann fold flavoprotein
MIIYDIAVIGAGPAGCMAAIQGAYLGKKVVLLEKNDKIGRKLLLTANGRCNLTNTAPLEVFLENFGRRGSFYRDAFTLHSNHDLMDFFKIHGLDVTEQESGRVFPITENSQSVVDVLENVLDTNRVKIVYNYHLKHLHKQSMIFKLSSKKNQPITAHKVIIATGGVTYKNTGSTGEGLELAKLLGHHITPLKPGGIPLKVREKWVHELKGVSIQNVGLTIGYGGKFMPLPHGDLLFTHFGLSGPVILDMSNNIIELLDKYGDVKLYIDLKPEYPSETLKNQLIKDFQHNSRKSLKNYLKNYLPQNTIKPILQTIPLDPNKKLNQITKKERQKLQETLKALPLTITGHLPMNKALVTCGGVSRKEINPQTMESKLIDGLFFAGEIISGCGGRGGYNLQQAFSTGFLAGFSASE